MNTDSVRAETLQHIQRVRDFIGEFCHELLQRGSLHDASKLSPAEIEIFAEYTPKLKELTYGSDEYKEALKGMGVALEHHYQSNRHHPEHYENGIEDMSLVDLVEMFCDWRAAVERHADGDIMKSIQQNTERFQIDSQLARILKKTAADLA